MNSYLFYIFLWIPIAKKEGPNAFTIDFHHASQDHNYDRRGNKNVHIKSSTWSNDFTKETHLTECSCKLYFKKKESEICDVKTNPAAIC